MIVKEKVVDSRILEAMLSRGRQRPAEMTCECGDDLDKVCSACPTDRVRKIARRKGLDPNSYIKVATTTADSVRQRKLRIRNMQQHILNLTGRKPSRREVEDLIRLEGKKIYEREQAAKEQVVEAPEDPNLVRTEAEQHTQE